MTQLNLFALFHLNLAFSSIEEEQRPEVVSKCYWPLLRLPQAIGAPIAIEASGYTLECIDAIDSNWIAELRRLMGLGMIEFIGSGYCQIIGPLVPASVNRANLDIGQMTYERMLGHRPTVALVNEQAYSSGLVPLYLDAGFKAILADWDNVAAHHPEWPQEWKYHPQAARGADGRSIPLLWTNTMAFQKLQRLAHGDIEQSEYLHFVRTQTGNDPRVLAVYSNDAEVFDFRPKRFTTEDQLQTGEWQTIANAWARLASNPSMRFLKPSDALRLTDTSRSNNNLELQTAAYPVPVKKHKKYNITRWAVSGRDDLAINAKCHRVLRGLEEQRVNDIRAWRELCYLWSSDFRTHITQSRWDRYLNRLDAAVDACAIPALDLPVPKSPPAAKTENRWVEIETPSVLAVLNRRRGLAIQEISVRGDNRPAMITSLLHGYFQPIDLQFDWYSGNCVFEAPSVSKISDLEWIQPFCYGDPQTSDAIVEGTLSTPLGPIFKRLRFCAHSPRVEYDLVFDWKDWGRGSLRLGNFLLNPEAFDRTALGFATHLGGYRMETFRIQDKPVHHGAPVSFLVSASTGLGMTEGIIDIGDGRRGFRVEADQRAAPLAGLIQYEPCGDTFFCRVSLSALEMDDTRKPATSEAPRHFRFALNLGA